MAIGRFQEHELVDRMQALAIRDTTSFPVQNLPLELIGKIASYLPSNNETMHLLTKHKLIRRNFTTILAHLDRPKISSILSQLVNFATPQQWDQFFARLNLTCTFTNVPLHITLKKNHSKLATRLAAIQTRFSPIHSLTIKDNDIEIATIIPTCTKLQALHLRNFVKITDQEFCQIPFPNTLVHFCMYLHNLRQGSIADMDLEAINSLFQKCPQLVHFELRDDQESANPRHSISTAKWPSTLQSVHLAQWYFSQDELKTLLLRAPLLRVLEVRNFQGELTPQQFCQHELPQTFEQLVLTDDKTRKMFEKLFKTQPEMQRIVLNRCPRFLNALLLLAEGEKKPEQRRSLCEQMLKINPSFVPALEGLALFHYKSGDKEIGHTIVTRLSTFDTEALNFLLPLIKTLHRDNQPLALEVAKVAVRYSGKPVSFKAYLGDLLHRGTGCIREPILAEKLLEEAVKALSRDIDADAYRLARLSLAALLDAGAPGVVPNPSRAKQLRDTRTWK